MEAACCRCITAGDAGIKKRREGFSGEKSKDLEKNMPIVKKPATPTFAIFTPQTKTGLRATRITHSADLLSLLRKPIYKRFDVIPFPPL